MKGGSIKLILMAVIYLVITIVVFLIFGPFSGRASAGADSTSISKEERIIGNVNAESSGSSVNNYRERESYINTLIGDSETKANAGTSESNGSSEANGTSSEGPESGNQGNEGQESAGGNESTGNAVNTSEAGNEGSGQSAAAGSESKGEGSSASVSSDGKVHYYRFKVINIDSTLRVRDKGSFSGKVIARFKNGREGYVLEKGEEWSKIVTKEGTFTGYCYNDYLEFTEISKDEFIKDYVDQVK